MKKLLALVLALVMTLSLCTISNAAYSDAADVDYNEAVDVMSAVGVFQGADGKFSPKAELTREQAAKLIAYLDLGESVAEALPAVKAFSDVEASRWSAKYIAYCADAGYINGVGDGSFNPAGKLTGYAFGKMLLCALGYEVKTEGFTGANWLIKVAKLMESNDIAKGVKTSASATLTREQAAQYCLNALKATCVKYDNSAIITVGDVEIKQTNKAAAVPAVTAYDKIIAGEGMQLGEKLYKGDLKLNTTVSTDDFYRPSSVWNYKQTKVGTYATTPDLTYTAAVKLGDIYADLGLSNAMTGAETAAANKNLYYIDGAKQTEGSLVNVSKGNTAKIGGNGTLTEVYYDDTDNSAVIVSVNSYVGEVTSITAATASAGRKITVIGYTNDAINGTFETDDFAKGDVVVYTVSHKTNPATIESVAATTKVTGELTAYVANTSVSVDGTTYKYSAKKDTMASGDLKVKVDVYLDTYGYAVDVEGADIADNYAYVLKIGTGTYDGDKVAQLLLADGSKVDAKIHNEVSGTMAVGDVVTYDVRTDGTYDTKVVFVYNESVGGNNLGKLANGDKLTVAKNSSTITLDNSATAVTVVADGKTQFIIVSGTSDNPIYNVYTGYANVPAVEITAPGAMNYVYAYANGTDGKADFVYIDARNSAVLQTGTTAPVFVLGPSSAASLNKDSLGEYYTFKAVVDGKYEENFKVSKDFTSGDLTAIQAGTSKIYSKVNYDKNGLALSGIDGNTATGTVKAANDTIGLGSSFFAYTNDCTVFYVDVDGNVTESSIAAIATDSTDAVFYVKNSDNKVCAIVIKQVVSTNNTLAIAVSINGGDVAGMAVATGDWTTTGGHDGTTVAKAKYATSTTTTANSAASAAVVVTKTLNNTMASISLVSGTEPTTTAADKTVAETELVYRVVAESGAVCYYKLTLSVTAAG